MAERKKNKRRFKREKSEFDNKLLDLARVTRVVKGGRRFRFRATVVLGNRKGKVGVGVAKGTDVSIAIAKASESAKKHMIVVPMAGHTIAHDVSKKLGSARVMLRPAVKGRGIVAGGAMRAVFDLAGVRDVVSKSFGTANKLNVARATIAALQDLKEARKKPVTDNQKPKADN